MKLRIWHIPQNPIPMNALFVPVQSGAEGKKILNVLVDYDLFQFEHHIKPDYSNVQGIEQYNEETGEWENYE